MSSEHQASGGEGFVIVKENSKTEHWEGSLASPALAAHPDDPNILLASNDLCEEPRTQVHLSRDRGGTWVQQATLEGQYWSSIFFHRGSLYLLGTAHEYGDIVIRRSDDLGITWTHPNDKRHSRAILAPASSPTAAAPLPALLCSQCPHALSQYPSHLPSLFPLPPCSFSNRGPRLSSARWLPRPP